MEVEENRIKEAGKVGVGPLFTFDCLFGGERLDKVLKLSTVLHRV